MFSEDSEERGRERKEGGERERGREIWVGGERER